MDNDNTPANQNTVYRIPGERSTDDMTVEQMRTKFDEITRPIRDEVSNLAISRAELLQTPLYLDTRVDSTLRQAEMLPPAIKEYNRVTDSISIMRQQTIERAVKQNGMSGNLMNLLGIKNPQESKRAKLRELVIEDEAIIGGQLFAKHGVVPEGQVWRFYSVNGDWYQTIALQQAPNAPTFIAHYELGGPRSDQIMKTSTLVRQQTPSEHQFLNAEETDKFVDFLGEYETLVAGKIHFPVAGRRRKNS